MTADASSTTASRTPKATRSTSPRKSRRNGSDPAGSSASVSDTSARLASTTAEKGCSCPGHGGDGTAMTVLFAHRAATSAKRAEPPLAQQHSRTKPVAALSNSASTHGEQRDPQLIMNTANKIKRITAVQGRGDGKSANAREGTSLRALSVYRQKGSSATCFVATAFDLECA